MRSDSPNLAISQAVSSGADAVVFKATLRPHRSLDRKGHAILFAFVFGVSVVISIPFYILGALPVVGFFGLDALLLWIAFRVSNQRARAYEEIVVTHIELLFRRFSWRGRLSEWRFNPLWVKLWREDHAEFGTQRLALVEGKRAVELGAFLGAEEKADFAGALKAALAEARKGPRFT
ncbi:MAG: DUF2244 domain-containing protein [Beijerinckiaceae bacterium]